MKRECEMLLKTILDEAAERDPGGSVEIISDQPGSPNAKLTWRIKMRGQGLYMGRADEYTDEKGEKFIALADPDTFIPESLADRTNVARVSLGVKESL
jgi:hypothetical protein